MTTQQDHISQNKELLKTRSHIIRTIREFFWNEKFLEVETPIIVRIPGQEPYLSPMSLNIRDDKGMLHKAYLHTSPEYTMKKMLTAGFENIFSICKTFRDKESFGGIHNPEFTMIEWYRVGATMFNLMDDVESLFDNFIKLNKHPAIRFKRISMRDLWLSTINVNLDSYLTQSAMYELCKIRKYDVKKDESYEDLFYRIFLNEIEPTLSNGAYNIHHYPAPMAALAKLSETEPGYAERFEVYINGMEIANAFTELTDASEQLKRLEEEQALRKKLGKDVYDIDMDFIEAIKKMPECAGIALGVDRLVQVLTGCQDINDVLVLPASKLFKNS
jgi:elongation factor P--(R)-beta-lysine ligase